MSPRTPPARASSVGVSPVRILRLRRRAAPLEKPRIRAAASTLRPASIKRKAWIIRHQAMSSCGGGSPTRRNRRRTVRGVHE